MVRVHRVRQRQAAGEGLWHLDAAHLLLARIAADKDHLDALVQQPGLLEQGR